MGYGFFAHCYLVNGSHFTMSTPPEKPTSSAPPSLSELAARRAAASPITPRLKQEPVPVEEIKSEGWRPIKAPPMEEEQWDKVEPPNALKTEQIQAQSRAPLNSQATLATNEKDLDFTSSPFKSTSSKPTVHKLSPDALRLREKLAQISQEELLNGVKFLFGQADDTLFKFAEQSGGQDNQEFILGFKSLRQNRIAVEKSFQDSIRQNWFPEKISDKENPDKNMFASLSLVNDDELEESLAESMAVAQINKSISSEVPSLLKRLNVLDQASENTKEIPVSPEFLSEAFKKAMRQVIDLPTTVKMIVFKLFDRHVLTLLPNLLIKLNQTLSEAGILPNLKPSIVHAAPPSGSGTFSVVASEATHHQGQETVIHTQAAQGHSYAAQAPAYPPGFVPAYPPGYGYNSGFVPMAHAEMVPINENYGASHASIMPAASFSDGGQPMNWGAVQSVLATARSPSPMVRGARGQMVPAPVVPISDLVSVINQLNQTMSRFEGVAPGEVKTVLKEALSQRASKPGSEAESLGTHENAIDMIDLLFEFILKDSELPSTIQALLARLQIPYLRIAVLEPQLFSEIDHPARVFLNQLSEAGKTWSEASDKNGELKQLIHDLVRRATENNEQGAPLFKNLLLEFDQKWIKMKERAKIAERRIAESALGKERLEHARKLSAQAIVDHLAGVVLPDKLRMAIHRPWAYYMTLSALKEGEDSNTFLQASDLLKKVAEFSRITPSPRGNAHRKTEINMLLEQWGKGLHVAGLFEEEIDSWKNVLESYCYERLGLDNIPAPAPNAFRPLPHEDVAATATESALPNQEVNVNFLEQVNALKVGQWVEWRLAGGYDSVRAKLAWIGGFTGKLLFVDRRGLKSVETHKQILARELEQGEALLLSEEPLMDQALNAIGKKLSIADI